VFSCLLAQVDALQAGVSVENAIAKAVGRSLEGCWRTLKGRVEEFAVREQQVLDNGDARVNGQNGVMQQEENNNDQDWFPRDDIVSLRLRKLLDHFQDVLMVDAKKNRLTISRCKMTAWISNPGFRQI